MVLMGPKVQGENQVIKDLLGQLEILD